MKSYLLQLGNCAAFSFLGTLNVRVVVMIHRCLCSVQIPSVLELGLDSDLAGRHSSIGWELAKTPAPPTGF